MRARQLNKAGGCGVFVPASVRVRHCAQPRADIGPQRGLLLVRSFPPASKCLILAHDPPAGMQLDSGKVSRRTTAADGSIRLYVETIPRSWLDLAPPSDNIPGPGRYDPIDADDWMLDTRRPCYNF